MADARTGQLATAVAPRRAWLKPLLIGGGACLLLGAAIYGGATLLTWSRLLHVFAATGVATVCGGEFITGRGFARIDAESFVKRPPRDRIYENLTFAVDREQKRVTADGPLIDPIHAVLADDRGCVLLPSGADPHATPVARSAPVESPKDRYEAPTIVTSAAVPEGVDATRLDAAVAANFAKPEHRTHSLLIFKGGVLLREVYAQGAGPRVANEGWSFGKTLVGALAGRLIQDGALTLDEPVRLTRWSAPDDARRGMRVRDLLTMSSGLEFTTEGTFWPVFRQSDSGLVYTNLPDVEAFVADRPLARPPGTRGDYNNADPILLLAHIRERLGLDNPGLVRLIREKVLDPLGMGSVVLSTDPKGMPVITGYVYGSAREWAQLGLAYAGEGQVGGVRLFGGDYAAFAAKPAPAYPDDAYGGLIWLNRHGYYAAPRSALVMAGAGDQAVVIDAETDLVIVRMGHVAKSQDAFDAFNASLHEMFASFGIEAVPPKSGRHGAGG